MCQQDLKQERRRRQWKRRLKKWICVLSNLIASIWTRSKCQMSATFPGVEFLRILFRFKNRKENSSSYVHVLQITWCRAVVLIIKTIVFFWSRRCGPRRSCLSSLLLSQKNVFRFKNRKENSSYVHVLQIMWSRAVVLIIKTIVFLKSSLWSSS